MFLWKKLSNDLTSSRKYDSIVYFFLYFVFYVFLQQNGLSRITFKKLEKNNVGLLLAIKGPLLGLRQSLTTESPLKMMKNASYFIFKAFFVLEVFRFLSWLFVYVEKQLDEKAKVNFKISDVLTGQKISTIHILPSISRSKGNQAMKFGQLIKYNVKNIFLEKSYRKWDRD